MPFSDNFTFFSALIGNTCYSRTFLRIPIQKTTSKFHYDVSSEKKRQVDLVSLFVLLIAPHIHCAKESDAKKRHSKRNRLLMSKA